MTAMTNIKDLKLHPDFPEKVWVFIEQPCREPYRFYYDPVSNMFMRKTIKSLIFERGFSGAYGWIGGMGTPPAPHFDVLLITGQNPSPGEVLEGYICDVFFRADGDHKFVAIDSALRYRVYKADLDSIDRETHAELMRLYPRIGENEGWFGAEVARTFLKENKPMRS
jgi:hypothetical protein